MRKAIDETERRRRLQIEFNKKNNITPTTIKKAVKESIELVKRAEHLIKDITCEGDDEYELRQVVSELEEDMKVAARNLQFEKAISLREQIKALNKNLKDKNEK